MNVKRTRTRNRGYTEVLVTAVVIMLICFTIIAGTVAYFVTKGIVQEEYAGYILLAAHLISVLVGCSIVISNIAGKYIVFASLTAGVYFLIFIGMNIVFFDGVFTGIVPGVITVTVGVLLACTVRLTILKNKFRSNHY